MAARIRIGDSIEFRAATRTSDRKAIREVVDILSGGSVVVSKYHGWTGFIVRPHEIIRVIRKEA